MFTDTLPQILALSFLISIGSFGFLLALGGPVTGLRWGELGLAVSFLAGFTAWTRGVPIIDDIADPAIGFAAVTVILAGALLALLRVYGQLAHIITALGGLAAVVTAFRGTDITLLQTGQWLSMLALLGAAIALPFRLRQIAAADFSPYISLVLACAGLAAIAFLNYASALGELSLVLTVCLLGIWLWVVRVRTLYLGPVALLISCVLLLSLAASYVHNAAYPPWALLPLLLCFSPDLTVRMLAADRANRRWKREPWRRKGWMLLASGLPAFCAACAAWILARIQG